MKFLKKLTNVKVSSEMKSKLVDFIISLGEEDKPNKK